MKESKNDQTTNNKHKLHRLIWDGNVKQLREILSGEKSVDVLEKKDVRGRTPLLLAIVLEQTECVKLLLDHGANCLASDSTWNVLDEAICRQNLDIYANVIAHKKKQLAEASQCCLDELMKQLNESPDFYIEMQWTVSTWIPFVTRLLPSDIYKIYKSGTTVRVDYTLAGIEGTKLQRDQQSCIINISRRGIEMKEKKTSVDQMIRKLECVHFDVSLNDVKIEKSTSWTRRPQTEVIDKYDCGIFNVSNVKCQLMLRIEHCSEKKKEELHKISNALSYALHTVKSVPFDSKEVTKTEYFDETINLQNRDVTAPKEVIQFEHTLNGTLWMCDNYPLNLKQHILPILTLLGNRFERFQHLREFIESQLPSGFAVKIEMPLLSVFKTTVNFSNLFGSEKHVDHVTCITSNEEASGDVLQCKVDSKAFDISSNKVKTINVPI